MAVAWLAFGVPQFLSVPRTVEDEIEDPAAQLSGAVRVLRASGSPQVVTSAGTTAQGGLQVPSVPLVGADGQQFAVAELSTRLTRRAELSRLRQVELAAVRIRRRALLGLLALNLLVAGGALAGWWSWWWCTGGGALLALGFVALRMSVVLVGQELDRRIAALREGNHERTLAISRADLLQAREQHEEQVGREGSGSDASRTSREVLSYRRPLLDDLPSQEVAPSLWEPVPVTAPTYVQRPIAARTVRTIDLSSPDLNAAMDRAQGELPVTADGRDGRDGEHARRADRASRRPRLRAVGE